MFTNYTWEKNLYQKKPKYLYKKFYKQKKITRAKITKLQFKKKNVLTCNKKKKCS